MAGRRQSGSKRDRNDGRTTVVTHGFALRSRNQITISTQINPNLPNQINLDRDDGELLTQTFRFAFRSRGLQICLHDGRSRSQGCRFAFRSRLRCLSMAVIVTLIDLNPNTHRERERELGWSEIASLPPEIASQSYYLTDVAESYLLALCESDQKKELLLTIISLGHLPNIFRSLGRLLLESFVKKFILELKSCAIGAENTSNFIYDYAISMPNIADSKPSEVCSEG
ncbi:Pentatricopeptide repeat-containing protein [Camellia lanceoleosa]|uniref:Pentatricopeptide repeat-containing protein n=1 Tax=Camellia lanceoleosa TaxID=1840588 RepID=A0ACC0H9B8_9ERIC|nr:Pentatricopeptide repeat-containing protein [Camellia lanceoleosa]